MDKKILLDELIITKTINEKERFEVLKGAFGIDKLLELYNNYISVMPEQKSIRLNELEYFISYEHSLASVLYTILRIGEDSLKAFLCNLNLNKKLEIESRPSNFTKTKYYFLFPCKKKEPLKIRTFNYTSGPVNYYDAIREMDFGDINLVFSHLSKSEQSLYSQSENIVEGLDLVRKLRNYVYHHNLLFSLGKNTLERTINELINSIELTKTKKYFTKVINKISKSSHLNPKFHILIS